MADESTHGRGHGRRGRKGRKLNTRSRVWVNFERTVDDQGNLLKSVCKYCHQEYVGSYGTSNLKRHYEKLCPGPQATAVEAQPLVPPGSLSSEHDPVVEHEAAAAVTPPLPLSAPPCASSGATGSSDREPGLGQDEISEDYDLSWMFAWHSEITEDLTRLIESHGDDMSINEDGNFNSSEHPLRATTLPTPTSDDTATPGSFDTTCNDQDATFRESLPMQARVPAVIKCVRVTSIDFEDHDFAYQAMVAVNGHVFRGFLYDNGSLEDNKGLPNISELHL